MAMAKFRGLRLSLLITALFMTSNILVISGQSTGVFLSLNGMIIPSDGYVLASDIGTGDSGLHCNTDRIDCCRGSVNPSGTAQGHWYHPDGSEVMSFTAEDAARPEPDNFFSRDRATGIVRLNRYGNPTERGRFHCEIPDASGNTVTLYLNIVDMLPTTSPLAQSLATTTQSPSSMTTQSGTITQADTDISTQATHTTAPPLVGVSLELLGQTIPNNSLVNLDDLLYRTTSDPTPTNANGLQTLTCTTDLVACCEIEGLGNWYYPDGRIVSGEGSGASFQTNRGQNEFINGLKIYGSVRLWRRFTPSERGLFHCELPDAENVFQTLYVTILFFSPIAASLSVAISPSGSATAGDTYSLTCSAILHSSNPSPDSNIPSPNFEWFFGPNANALLPSGLTPTPTVLNSGTYTSTLQFSPLSQSHVGNYTCRLGAGSLVNSAMVTVNVPALSVQITTSGSPMLGQSGYSLMCSVSGAEHISPNITYQWTKNNGTQTQIQVGADPKVLSFSPLRLSDAGRYTCQATVSSPYLNNDITRMDLQDVTLQILAPTSIVLSSSITNPIPPFGSDVTLTCTAVFTSGPEIDVPLDVNFELLRTDPAGSPLTTTLPSVSGPFYITMATINSFQRSDSGVHTCRAIASSASTNTYLSDSNTESGSFRVTTGVYLVLRDMFIANNSNINIRSIGQSSDNPNGALQCITDRIPCCLSQNARLGEWYLPNKELVQGTASTVKFYRSRGDNGEVSLNRPSDILSPFGLYCCEVPDATDASQTLCVNIGTTCEDGSVRLVDGAHLNEGRLEICVNGTWGTVCNDGLTDNAGFDIDAARVVCRQLGFPEDDVITNVSFGGASSSQPTHLDNVQCTGSEPNLLNCSHNGIGIHNCGSNHEEDIGIICEQSQDCRDGSVRLVDGDNYNVTAGRVEYCVGGRWGTVCNFNWGEADATVVCRQLGLNTFDPKVLSDVPRVKNLMTPIVLDGLNCQGVEASLGQCGHAPVVEHCSHSDDAGANCTIIIGPPPVQTFCSVVIWSNPQLPCDDIMGYEVRLYNPDSGKEVNRSVDSYSMSYVIKDEDKLQVEIEKAYVQVRVLDKVLGARKWSDGISLGCEAPNEGIHFVHQGQIYLNNSVISLHLIGENENALLCKTDRVDCCGTPPNRFGEFYFPYGAKVPIRTHGLGFYRNRGKQEIRLHRREGVTTPAGRFHCQIPDARGDLQTIYIELVP